MSKQRVARRSKRRRDQFAWNKMRSRSRQGVYAGGFALYAGHAYVSYDLYDQNSGNDTYGVAVCDVANDGSLSGCADSGQTFTSTVGIAIH